MVQVPREPNNILSAVKTLLKALIRPGLTFFSIREQRRLKSEEAKEIRSDISTDNLPKVTLMDVGVEKRLRSNLLHILKRNPSPNVLTPKSKRVLHDKLERGTEYYLVLNGAGKTVGAIGFQPWRRMVVNLTIDYSQRNKGYGLSALTELERMAAEKGFEKIRAQIFISNNPSVSLFLSLRWKLVEKADLFFTFEKTLTL